LEALVTLCDGRQVANPRILRVAERRLTRAKRRVSRRTQWSHRRQKAVRLLATAHQKGVSGADRLSATGGARFGPPVRHDLLRRCADGQPAQEPPSGEVHRGCRVAWVPDHPRVEGSLCREAGWSRAGCLYEPAMFWPAVQRCGVQRVVRAVALLPHMWHEPAPGLQSGQEQRTGRAGCSGSRGVGCGEEPSIPRLQAGECQDTVCPDGVGDRRHTMRAGRSRFVRHGCFARHTTLPCPALRSSGPLGAT
jgi:hypothetical protein